MNVLQIPPFCAENDYLRNYEYRLLIREQGQNWQPIVPYTVRINDNFGQNIELSDPVKLSPMIYFSMGDRPAEILVEWLGGSIRTAEILPSGAGSVTVLEGGRACVTVTRPAQLCLRINGERYELVYIFANPPEEAPEASEDVVVIPAGHTEAPFLGENVWNGSIRDVRLYRRALTADEAAALTGGREVEGYTYRWPLQGDLAEESGQGTPTMVGDTVFEETDGVWALRLDGCGNRLDTGLTLPQEWAESYSLTAWVYLREGAPRHCQILQELLHIYADGTVCTNIGSWEHPYRSHNLLTAGAWHQLTLTKQGSDVTLYIDGESGGTETRKPQTRGYGLVIGAGDMRQQLVLRDHQTLYLAPGAVLHGTVVALGVRDVRICGSGIIDITPRSEWQTCFNGILVINSQDVEISGVIVNNPRFFSVRTMHSERVHWSHVKIFSSYGPSDGFNVYGAHDVTAEHCFIRCNDDGFSLSDGCARVTIRHCVLTNDVAHAFFFSSVEDVLAEDMDILDSKQGDFGYQGVFGACADGGHAVRNITFRDIRVGAFLHNKLFEICTMFNPVYTYEPGKIVENILFENITYAGFGHLPCEIHGYDETRPVRNVCFRNVTVNGQRLTEETGIVRVGRCAEQIVFE